MIALRLTLHTLRHHPEHLIGAGCVGLVIPFGMMIWSIIG